MNRRKFFLQSNAVLLGIGCVDLLGATSTLVETNVNLVPSQRSTAPNYWCTWGAQTAKALRERPDAAAMNAVDLTAVIEDYINEKTVFGAEGWARTLLPKVRGDLYFMFDGGWSTTYSSFVADRKKFPSYAGTPDDVILEMNRAVQAAGWRGAALWCRDTPGGEADAAIMRTLRHGRIGYVKIDVGDANFHLVSLRNSMHVPVTFEHVSGVDGGLNGKPDQDGRYPLLAASGVQASVLKHTDVYRIYDLQGPVDLPTALDRVSQTIRVVEGNHEARALINAEHEVYLAAVLGCTVGIMQHESAGGKKPSTLDQVTRAIRWQRIAPPFGAGSGFLRLDTEILIDDWTYTAGDASYAASAGSSVKQGAPARVTRNMELPEVNCAGDKPFVLASRFANGAIAIGSLPRVRQGRPAFVPAAAVTMDLAGAAGPIGIFGSFGELTLTGRTFSPSARVLAQDLAGDRATDITSRVAVSRNRLQISGDLLRSIGLASATPGDRSLPALVLKVF